MILLAVYGGGDACRQMALDEAMGVYAGCRGVGLARIYWFTPSAVTLGYFQKLSEAVNLDEATRLGVDVVRRLSGGGSVLHDEKGEVTYSIAVPVEWLNGINVEESFRLLASWVYEAIRLLGLEPRFEGLNDIVVKGRKVSGNAQFRRYGAVVQHGTILYNPDIELMKRVLRIPRGKGRGAIEERVGSLSQLLGRRLSRREVVDALLKAASKLGEALDARVELADSLPRLVYELADSLQWRYCSREWLEKRV